MSVNDANDFVPEHLARWRKVTCEYLFAPMTGDASRIEPATPAMLQPALQDRGSRSVLLSWAQRALLHLLRRATQSEENPLRALESAFYFQMSFMAKYPAVPRTLMAWYAQTGDSRVRTRIDGAIGHYESRLARLIGKAKQQGLVGAAIDAGTAASLLVGMIQGLALRMNAGLSRPETLLREATTAFPVYLDGIRSFPLSACGTARN